MMMMVVTGVRATAQEALRSSLAYDQAVPPRQNEVVNPEPDQPHLGPAQLTLGAYTSVDYMDNVFYTQSNPQSDFILHAGVTTGIFWPLTTLSDITLNTGIGYAHYLKSSQNDYVEVTPNSVLNWNISLDDVVFTFYDQFSYTESVVTQPALVGTATFPIFDNTAGARVNWTPNQWLFQAGYSYDDYVPESPAFNYLERTSDYFFVRGAWRFAENTQAGLEASDSLTSYTVASQSGNSSVSVGPYAEWQITQAIHATIRGGPTFYFFDSSGAANQGSSLGSYYFGLQISHQLTDFLSHQISINREVSLGLNQGGNYSEQLTGTYSVSLALTQNIGLTVNASYVHGTQTFQNLVPVFPGFGLLLNQTENFDQYSMGPAVSWQATKKFSTSLSYNYYVRDSNLPARGYIENSFSMKLNYAF